MDLFAAHANPYMGILAYVVAPMFLLMGLAMVLLGYILETRRIRKGQPRDGLRLRAARRPVAQTRPPPAGRLRRRQPRLPLPDRLRQLPDLSHDGNQFVLRRDLPHADGAASSRPISTPPTPRSIASPATSARAPAPTSAPRSAACASSIITILGDFNRPIQLLNVNQRPAQETCQSCHWSQKHTGDLQKTYRHFLADETNTPFTVQMILKVGGSDPVHGPVEGIHSHMNVSNKIEFIATR